MRRINGRSDNVNRDKGEEPHLELRGKHVLNLFEEDECIMSDIYEMQAHQITNKLEEIYQIKMVLKNSEKIKVGMQVLDLLGNRSDEVDVVLLGKNEHHYLFKFVRNEENDEFIVFKDMKFYIYHDFDFDGPESLILEICKYIERILSEDIKGKKVKLVDIE